jgi:hypothetical protein
MKRTLLLAFLFLTLAGAVPFPQGSPVLSEDELFPVAPAVDDQRGFAVAVDGGWLALGARLEDEDVDKQNAGAVHLFHFEDGAWKHQSGVLWSHLPRANGQFGFAVTLRGGTLAVGAPGEKKVQVFVLQGNQWNLRTELEAAIDRFGSAVAMDGDWLAVAGGDPHGESPGAVHIYRQTDGTWNEAQSLAGGERERFGHAVSLRGGTLVIGAPGADGSKGATYVYTLTDGTWSRTATLKDSEAAEGDQLGFSVATNGQDVVVGAPTTGTGSAGAAWVWRPGDGLKKLQGGDETGAQLGYAVAIDGDRIAAGAPFGGEKLFGAISVFERKDGAWSEGKRFEAASAGVRDLSGFSVAVAGEWVILGTVLGDQGGPAAGSVSTIRCRPGKKCLAWSEPAVPGKAGNETFGISVAADGDAFAVGASGKDLAAPRGSVTVFRRAAQGWRQEARLIPAEDHNNEFGAAVALAGDLLVVGDPLGRLTSAGGDPLPRGGAVYLFRWKDGAWVPEGPPLEAPYSDPEDRFGRSVATDGSTVVVGAEMSQDGLKTGAAYVFELQQYGGWSAGAAIYPGVELATGDDFGAAVTVQGDTIGVGAPFAHGHTGEVHVFERTGGIWTWRKALASGALQGELGSSVALSAVADTKVLAVGAPRQNDYAGEAYLFEGSGATWILQPLAHAPATKQAFGSAVAVRGKRLVVGAPVVGQVTLDTDRVYYYTRNAVQWQAVGSVDALPRVPGPSGERAPIGDNFGSGVAIGKDFFVVTSPGKKGGDRVTVFELPPEVTP